IFSPKSPLLLLMISLKAEYRARLRPPSLRESPSSLESFGRLASCPLARVCHFSACPLRNPRQGLFFRLLRAGNSPRFYLHSRGYITIAAKAGKKRGRGGHLPSGMGLPASSLQGEDA